jgi:hypothetical protein
MEVMLIMLTLVMVEFSKAVWAVVLLPSDAEFGVCRITAWLMKGSVTTFRPKSPQPTRRKRRSGLTISERTG